MSRRGAFAILLLGLVAVVGCSDDGGEQHVSALRQAFALFPSYPGAMREREEVFEHRSDGGGTGDYELRVTYRLPADSISSEVTAFYKDNVPEGWRPAIDSDCQPPSLEPPAASGSAVRPSLPSGPWVLSSPRRIVTFYPIGAPSPGVTLTVFGVGSDKFLTFGSPILSCEPAGPPRTDRIADEFDRGPS